MVLRRSCFVLLVLCVAAPALALAPRVFVSSSGVDTGTCPISAPCRNFAYAITQVNPGGELIALDTAGYGPVTIGQSITIAAAPGATAFIAASSALAPAIMVSAGPADLVTLRGLSLTSTGALTGINFSSGLLLNVENCIVNGFPAYGIFFGRNFDQTHPRLQLLSSLIRGNANGIYVSNTDSGASSDAPRVLSFVTIANSSLTGNSIYSGNSVGNGTAINAGDNARFAISDTVFAANDLGVYGSSLDWTAAQVNLDRCNFSRNGIAILAGYGSGQLLHLGVRLANCMVTGNDTGVQVNLDGYVLSRESNGVLTNTIEGNNQYNVLGTMGTYVAK